MISAKETFIHDAELEIVVPYDVIECNEDKIDDIINAPQRTDIFYDESLHFYLVTTLPPESNLENKEEATEFFKKLEVTFEATLIDAHLTVPTNFSQLSHRRSSSSSTISGILSSGSSIRSRSSSNSSTSSTPSSIASDYSIKRSSTGKYTEGTVIYSAHYNSKNKKNNKMVVVERDNCWVCVLPLSFPVAYIKTRAQAQVALNISVIQPQRNQRKVKAPDVDLYSMDNFGVNLLEGLTDDPAFTSLNTSCTIPTSRLTKQDLTKKSSIYSSLPSTTIKRCSRKLLSVKPTLNVRIRTTNLPSSENSSMMSVDLENDTDNNMSFSIESVKVDIDHAFVTRFGWSQDGSNENYPILLQPVDQVTFLYNVTMLEDSSFPIPLNAQHHYSSSRASSRRESIASISSTINELPIENKYQYRPLSIIVRVCPIIDGVKLRCIESKWNSTLDTSTLSVDDSMILPQLGRVASKQTICDDKFNYNSNGYNGMVMGGINMTSTSSRESIGSNYGLDIKNHNNPLDNIGYGNNSSDAGLEINVIDDSVKNNTLNMNSFKNNMLNMNSFESVKNNMLNMNSFKNNALSMNSFDSIKNNALSMNSFESVKNNTHSMNSFDSENNGILPRGRLPKIQKQDLNSCNGVSVSFTVCGKPVAGKVFAVKVSMVNKSNYARNFTIAIPNNKKKFDDELRQSRLPHNVLLSQTTQSTDITLVEFENNNKKFIQPLEDPLMEEMEFYKKHLESETPNANLICLDNNVRIGPINPYKSESATLHFISTKEALQVVDFIQLIDDDTGFMTNLRNVVQVHVDKPWNANTIERRIDHNSIVAKYVEVAC